MATLDKLFVEMKTQGASDLHLSVGHPPLLRLKGGLVPMKFKPMTNDLLEKLIFEVMRPDQVETFKAKNDMDFSYSVEGVARFRGNAFRDQRGVGAVFRIIPTEIKTLDEMGYPEGVRKIAQMRKGLVLVTGPTGSGKSTTLASIIHEINLTLEGHIITIEDPIEFVHQSRRCIVTQREVHYHTHNFANALRAACREDPDVILVGEMRDYETIRLALTAAELGVLVFGTLHTNGAAQTIDRIIDVFPEDGQSQARSMLADSLQGVVSQLLLKTADGKGRCAVQEIMMGSQALSSMIREAKSSQITSVIQTGQAEGMQTFDQALKGFVASGKITKEAAYSVATEKKQFQ
jgi:twitching motility protein PilT